MKIERQTINGRMTRIKHTPARLVLMISILAMSFLVLYLTYLPATLYGSSQPIATVSEKQYEFGEVSEGSEIGHDFLITNRGTELLTISNVKTG